MLDDTSTSFCHSDNPFVERNLMPLDLLRKAFMFALKSNMNIQLVYPNYELPNAYKDAIFEVEHTNIVSAELSTDADVVVLNSIDTPFQGHVSNLIIRDTFRNIVSSFDTLVLALSMNSNVSIVIKDIDKIEKSQLEEYKSFLDRIVLVMAESLQKGKTLQLSNVTNRLTISKMNNCNAGWRSITLAPNGKFYICPSFYYDDVNNSVGDINCGIKILNSQLYQLSYAPICSICDCYHCKRCVWLNKRLTNEVNTPSYEQCVLAHHERNASKKLLDIIREHSEYLKGVEIPLINYLDPLEIINRKS